jgi:uncharacterized protein with FMN-binding domain
MILFFIGRALAIANFAKHQKSRKKEESTMFKKIASIVLASSLVFGVVVPAAYADTAGAKYKDGTYTGEASVVPDENEEFGAYGIKVDVTVENGAVTGVRYSADMKFNRSN